MTRSWRKPSTCNSIGCVRDWMGSRGGVIASPPRQPRRKRRNNPGRGGCSAITTNRHADALNAGADDSAGLDRTRELAAFDPTATNGLRVRSQVMADKPVTIRRERVGRQIGHLDDQDIARLNVAADGGPAGTPGASFSCVTVLGSELLGSQSRHKSAYVDLRILMIRSANVSSRRLLLGWLNRLETKPTGPPAA